MEMGIDRRQLVGVPYRALISFDFGGNWFDVRSLSNPRDSPPDRVARVERIKGDSSPLGAKIR